MTAAVESGAGLHEVVRAAARALGASLAVLDSGGETLAVAARSSAEERALRAGAERTVILPLRAPSGAQAGDGDVGTLRARGVDAGGTALLRLLATLVAGEVERVRAPDRATARAASELLRAIGEGEDVGERLEQLGIDVSAGAGAIVARAHPQAPPEEGWRERVRAGAERGARSASPGAISAIAPRPGGPGAEVLLLAAARDQAALRRTAEAVLTQLEQSLGGHTFAVGCGRVVSAVEDLRRGLGEALLAANVAEGKDGQPLLSFDETGAYRLLLGAMLDDPAELQRFYDETVAPLVAYDQQYDTDLVRTLETFLDADGNVAGTAQRMFTHRHTIYYRLERVRELSGLDVSSSDGRERLSLGLKSMRVLGLAAMRGPASEAGAGAGRVPRSRPGPS